MINIVFEYVLYRVYVNKCKSPKFDLAKKNKKQKKQKKTKKKKQMQITKIPYECHQCSPSVGNVHPGVHPITEMSLDLVWNHDI